MNAVQEPNTRSPQEDLAQVAHDAHEMRRLMVGGGALSVMEGRHILDLIERLAAASLALGAPVDTGRADLLTKAV